MARSDSHHEDVKRAGARGLHRDGSVIVVGRMALDNKQEMLLAALLVDGLDWIKRTESSGIKYSHSWLPRDCSPSPRQATFERRPISSTTPERMQ